MEGQRQTKYNILLENGLKLLAPFTPSGERLQLVRSDSMGVTEYECGWPLPTIASVNSAGIVSARDELCVHFTEKQAWDTVRDFANRDPEDAREAYALGDDARDWQVAFAQEDLRDTGPHRKYLQPVLYRPFDIRQTYYTGQTRGFLCMPRPEVMRHMLAGSNLGITVGRQGQAIDESAWQVLHVSRQMTDFNFYRRGGNNLFPLWLYKGSEIYANLSPAFIAVLQTATKLTPADYRPEQPSAALHAEKIFHYLYAVLHSPAYRQRYATFLRTDFPRIPIPGLARCVRCFGRFGRAIGAVAFAGASGRRKNRSRQHPSSRSGGLVWHGLQLAEGR